MNLIISTRATDRDSNEEKIEEGKKRVVFAESRGGENSH